MGLLSGLGGLASALGSVLDSTGWLSHSSAKSNAKYGAQLGTQQQAYMLQQEPSLRRKGLEAAGYNPMLALGDLGGASASAVPVHGSVGSHDYDGFGQALRDELLQGERDVQKSQDDKIKAETDLTRERSESERLNRKLNFAKTVAGVVGSALGAKMLFDKVKKLPQNLTRAQWATHVRDGLRNVRTRPGASAAQRALVDSGSILPILGKAAGLSAGSAIGYAAFQQAIGRAMLSSGIEPTPNIKQVRARIRGLGSWRTKYVSAKRKHN